MNDIPETDSVKIAEREVIEAARAWWQAWQLDGGSNTQRRAELDNAEHKLLTAVTLLEAREGMAATSHLDNEK